LELFKCLNANRGWIQWLVDNKKNLRYIEKIRTHVAEFYPPPVVYYDKINQLFPQMGLSKKECVEQFLIEMNRSKIFKILMQKLKTLLGYSRDFDITYKKTDDGVIASISYQFMEPDARENLLYMLPLLSKYINIAENNNMIEIWIGDDSIFHWQVQQFIAMQKSFRQSLDKYRTCKSAIQEGSKLRNKIKDLNDALERQGFRSYFERPVIYVDEQHVPYILITLKNTDYRRPSSQLQACIKSIIPEPLITKNSYKIQIKLADPEELFMQPSPQQPSPQLQQRLRRIRQQIETVRPSKGGAQYDQFVSKARQRDQRLLDIFKDIDPAIARSLIRFEQSNRTRIINLFKEKATRIRLEKYLTNYPPPLLGLLMANAETMMTTITSRGDSYYLRDVKAYMQRVREGYIKTLSEEERPRVQKVFGIFDV